MPDQPQRPPYPPASPYPPQGNMPPRPVGAPPRPMGYPMPAGVKMPPRPMGYPMPAGVKMPPRPVGVPPMGMPPPGMAGGAYPAAPVASAVAEVPVPVDDTDIDKEWNEAENIQSRQTDDDGFIDDLEDDTLESENAEEEEIEPSPYEHNMASDLGLPPFFVKTKFLFPMFLILFACGGALGFWASMLQDKSGGSMPGVVYNMEIPKGRPRCGIAQKGQGCVLYIMNAQRREVDGRDFFSMAADILNIPKFQIETANIRYATVRIPPGYIALLNVPPVQ